MSRIISYQVTPNIKAQTGIGITYFPIRGWKLNDFELQNQSEATRKKRGFYLNPETKHFIFQFPQSFVSPMRDQADKYVVFQYCRATYKGHFSAELEVHSNFIPRDQYCDSIVYYCNLPVPDDNRKYQVNSIRDGTFEVWFVDGSQPDPDNHSEFNKVGEEDDGEGNKIPIYKEKVIVPDTFVLFLKLIY